MKRRVQLSGPSDVEIEIYLEKWKDGKDYQEPDEALRKLFEQTYPRNGDINEVLIKVYVLNSAYSAGVPARHVPRLARHIVRAGLMGT